MESQPAARTIVIVIIDFKFQYCSDPGEAVEHRGNERTIPQSGNRILRDCKRTASETAPRTAPLAFKSPKTLRTRSLQRRYLIRRTSDDALPQIKPPGDFQTLSCVLIVMTEHTVFVCFCS